MVNIQPVVFPIVGTATKLSVTVLGFATNAKTCGTYYALLTEDNVKVIENNYYLTEAEFTAWGVDNSYIDDIVASHLNVVIVPESMDDDAVDNGGGGVQSATLGAPNLD
jgi:hypothetical protein